MSLNDPLQNYEDFLEPDFRPLQFANDILKVTNNGTDGEVLDLKTCLKRCAYDLQELDRRIDHTIQNNPGQVLEQIEKRKAEKEIVGSTLKSNTEYLSMSYNRLQKDVLEPYETALKLQSVSSKIHQTTTLLRTSLLYIHMVSQLQSISLETQSVDDEQLSRGVKVAAIHSQLKANIEQNPNLSTLQFIKSCENNIVAPKRQELLRYLSTNLTRDCTNNVQIEHRSQRITTLMKALHTLSSVDLFDTINSILSSKIQGSSQTLIKTITSIKTFNLALGDVMDNRNTLLKLENLMKECETSGTSNIFRDYLSQKKNKSLIDQFWTEVSKNFKREFEMSYNRGGPVGKSLQNNAQFIEETIKKCFEVSESESSANDSLKTEQNYMRNAVSILNRSRK